MKENLPYLERNNKATVLSEGIRMAVRNGKTTRFWLDPWIEKERLNDSLDN